MTPAARPARRLSDEVEETLVTRILDGVYAPGTRLPLERELAVELGVGRPTLREAIQRLERDGWLTVRKSLGTLVNDYWHEGTLNILPAMVRHGGTSLELLGWVAELRIGITPMYVRQAVEQSAAKVVAILANHDQLPDETEAFVAFDTRWQTELAELAANPLFNLYIRSLRDAYSAPAHLYFAVPEYRERSRVFHAALLDAAMASDPERAEAVTRAAMVEAIEGWRNR